MSQPIKAAVTSSRKKPPFCHSGKKLKGEEGEGAFKVGCCIGFLAFYNPKNVTLVQPFRREISKKLTRFLKSKQKSYEEIVALVFVVTLSWVVGRARIFDLINS